MNTATETANCASTLYTPEEIKIHRAYAAKCARAKRFEDLSSRFMAMKAECQFLGLHWCTSQEFRNLVRTSRLALFPSARRAGCRANSVASQHYSFGATTRESILREHAGAFRLRG